MERLWWIKQQELYRRNGFGNMLTWEDMKQAMIRSFMPPDYNQWLHLQFLNLCCESMSVEAYYRKFFSMATKDKLCLRWGFMSVNAKGLKPQKLLVWPVLAWVIWEMIQVAYQIEEEKSHVDFTREKFVEKLGNGSDFSANRTLFT